MKDTITAFFAYPNEARISDAVQAFSEKMNKSGILDILPWEDMKIGGKLLVNEICSSIDSRDIFLADITKLNPNVLFEIGYAIAKKKRIWLIRDSSIPQENINFKNFKILTTIGYCEYISSEEILKHYYNELPHESLNETVYDKMLDQSLGYADSDQILYLKSHYEDEASNKVTQKLAELSKNSPLKLQIDDPRESSIQPLVWYASNVFNSRAVVCHLTHVERMDSRIQNAKHSLIAGMALGFNIPVLMLVENELFGPTDYREILYSYTRAQGARDKVESFISPYIQEAIQEIGNHRARRRQRNKIEALSKLKLGEPVAEHEDTSLIENAFIKTSAYISAHSGEKSIFVGRKGVGKTANFKKLSEELTKDRRNVVCEVSPLSYELTNLVEVAKKFEQISKGGYLFESLWKFLLYSEVAKSSYELIKIRPSQQIYDNEQALVDLIESKKDLLLVDFPSRMDKLVQSLLDIDSTPNDFSKDKIAVSEILHEGIISQLRKSISEALNNKQRIAILVDNLDKAWDRSGQTEFLSYFFLGLLSAQKRISNEFRGSANFDFTLCVFVRADIFESILDVAREPDKVSYEEVKWDDLKRLKVMANARIIAAAGNRPNVEAGELWEKFFMKNIQGVDLLDYILGKVLPRPRDLLFFLRSAVVSAVNSRHDRVEENDLHTAEKEYSDFAHQSLLVETREKHSDIEDILESFMGAEPTCNQKHLIEQISSVTTTDPHEVIYSLCMCSFLEMSIPNRSFEIVDNDKRYKRSIKAANNIIAKRGGEIRYKIHPAFWEFLMVSAPLPSSDITSIESKGDQLAAQN